MRALCPYCDKIREIEKIKSTEILDVRGEKIEVPAEFFKCSECANEFETNKSGYDSVAEAYRIYREKKHMVQPEQIKSFRETYDLTQKEFSALLGWGGATLSRYENGALQDETHDRILQLLINNAMNLLELTDKTPNVISETKKQIISEKIRNSSSILENLTEEILFSYNPDIFSGMKKFDMRKFVNMVLLFSEKGVYKTKLNKLLFYSDFKHFRAYGFSISGARYAHIPYGPSPDNFRRLFDILEKKRAIEFIEEINDDKDSERIFPAMKPDLETFSQTELAVINEVKEYFRSYSSRKITDFSHLEEGYKMTLDGGLISYEFAGRLRV